MSTFTSIKQVQFMKKLLYIALTLGALVSCTSGSGGGNADEVKTTKADNTRPAGTISGKAISGGTVTVYDWSGAKRGEALGSTTADDQGNYSVSVVADDSYVMIVAVGGYYIEPASGIKVDLKRYQSLKSLSHYVSGEASSVMVTPWTHIGVGYAEWHVDAGGADAMSATSIYNSSLTEILGVEANTTIPVDITLEDSNTSLTDGLIYGFHIASLSAATKTISENNFTAVHGLYNSIGLSQTMHADAKADGVLNGSGYRVTTEGLMTELIESYGIGGESARTEFYRRTLAIEMLQLAGSELNKTQVSVESLFTRVEAYSSSTHLIWGDVAVIPVDNSGPVITKKLQDFQVVSGEFTVGFSITDLLDIKTVTYKVDGEVVDVREGGDDYDLLIDTKNYEDGDLIVEITATDSLNNKTVQSFAVKIDNTAPLLTIDTENLLTGDDYFTLTVTSLDPVGGGVYVTVNGIEAGRALDDKFVVEIKLAGEVTKAVVRSEDARGNVAEISIDIEQDAIAPNMVVSFSSAKFYSTDELIQIGRIDEIDAPIYYTTDGLNIDNILTSEASFNAFNIPHIKIRTQDSGAVSTALNDLVAEYLVFVNNSLSQDWRRLPLVETNGGEGFLLPLTSEYYDQLPVVTHNEIIKTRIRITDNVGNSDTFEFDFTAYIDFPKLHVNTLIGSNVTAYEYKDGALGGVIGKCLTDSVGYCKIPVSGGATAIQLRVEGGHYIEPATTFSTPSREVVSYIHFLDENIRLFITPLSSVYAAMVERSDIDGGILAFTDLYDFHPYKTEPLPYAGADNVTAGVKLGLVLSGISGFSNENEGNSSELTRLMAVDYASDGLLDGVAILQVEPETLSFNGVDITANTYRTEIPNIALDSIRGDVGPIDEAFIFLSEIAGSGGGVFGDEPTVTIKLDEVPPVITATIPLLWSGAELIEFDISDLSTIASVEVFLGDELIKSFSGLNKGSFEVDSSKFDDGDYSVTITAADKYSNSSSQVLDIEIDNTASLITITSSNLSNSREYLLTGTFFDTSSAQLTANDVDISPLSEWEHSIFLVSGDNDIILESIDAGDNKSETLFSIFMDDGTPIVRIKSSELSRTESYTLHGTAIHSSAITVTVNGTEVPVLNGEWAINVALQSGNNEYQVVVTDRVGNQTDTSIVVNMDGQKPILVVTSADETNDPLYELTGTIEDDSFVEVTVNGSKALVSNGTWSSTQKLAIGDNIFNIESIDANGNVSALTHTTYMDNLSSILAITSGTSSNTKDFLVTGTINDNSDVTITINGEEVNYSGTTWGHAITLELGSNDITVIATDRTENVTTIASQVFMDDTLPLLTIDSSEMVTSAEYLLFGTASDFSTKVVTVNGRDIPVVEGNWSMRVTLKSGETLFEVVMTDQTGNSVSRSLIVYMDSKAPLLQITSPSKSLTTDYILAGRVFDDSEVTLIINNESVSVLDTNWLKAVTLTEGNNLFTFLVEDLVGNFFDSEFSISVDSISPQIVVSSAESTTNPTYRLEGTIIDNSPTTLTANGVNVPVLNGVWFTDLRLALGNNDINLRALDGHGNPVFTTHSVYMDNIAPIVSVDSPRLVNDAGYTLSGRVIDNSPVTLTVNGSPISVVNGAWSISLALEIGDNSFLIESTDQSGNSSVPIDHSVYMDNVAPVIAITSAALVNDSTYALTGTLSDDSTATLTIDGLPVAVVDGQWSKVFTLAVGNRTFTVGSIDRTSNASATAFTVFNDDVLPVLSVTSSMISSTSEYALTGRVADDSDVTLTVNGTEVTPTNGAWSFATTLPFGSSTFTVQAVDVAENGINVIHTVFADFESPALTVTSATVVNSLDYIITGTISDESTVNVFVDNVKANIDGGTWSLPIRITSFSPEISVLAIDATGNETRVPFQVHFDSLSPDVVLHSSSGQYWVDGIPQPADAIESNSVFALYIPIDHADIGSTERTVSGLSEAGYMFLDMDIVDPNTGGKTATEDLRIETRYSQNGTVRRDWKLWDHLSRVIPLTTSVMIDDWEAVDGAVHLIEIRAQDNAGNWGESSFQFTAHIASDFIAPTIVTDVTTVKFSKPDGSCLSEELSESNTSANNPICLDVTSISLGSKTITRALSSEGYVAVDIDIDDRSNGVTFTNAEDLRVEYQYIREDNIIVDWIDAPRQVDPKSVYLPLTIETLGDDFFITPKDVAHTINFRVTDTDGNVSDIHTFNVFIDVKTKELASDTVVLGNADIFDADFSRRVSLNRNVAKFSYKMGNDTDAPTLVKFETPEDANSIVHVWDSSIRTNRARVKTQEQWSMRGCVNCDNSGRSPFGIDVQWSVWFDVDHLWDSKKNRMVNSPAATFGAFEDISSDALLADNPGAWSDFAPNSICSETTNSGSARQEAESGLFACPSQRELRDHFNMKNIRKRDVYSIDYESGFPNNVITSPSETTTFGNHVIRVFNLDLDSEIFPTGGWYKIPPNTAIEVVNEITLPAIAHKNDERTGQFVPYGFPSLWDKSITYNLDSTLEVLRSIDAGVNQNVSVSITTLGDGIQPFTLSR